MISQDHFEVLIKKNEWKRKRKQEALRRRIEMGYVQGKVLKNGAISQTSPKGIQNWYTTRQLVDKVEEGLERTEGRLRINGKWNLQIRGKHMRRLKKKLKIKQVGRYIMREA